MQRDETRGIWGDEGENPPKNCDEKFSFVCGPDFLCARLIADGLAAVKRRSRIPGQKNSEEMRIRVN